MPGMAPKNDRVVSATLRVSTFLMFQELDFKSFAHFKQNFQLSTELCVKCLEDYFSEGR